MKKTINSFLMGILIAAVLGTFVYLVVDILTHDDCSSVEVDCG